jgi:histidine triad (HIT) family protein
VSELVSTSCVFCAIVAGDLPASVVDEDALSLAIMDIRPLNEGHVLVLPKAHYPSLAELPEPVGAHLFNVAQRVAAAVRRSGVRCEAVNLFLSDGEAAGQDVFHCHLHLLPRFVGDSFRIVADWSQRPTRAELDATASAIRAACAQEG